MSAIKSFCFWIVFLGVVLGCQESSSAPTQVAKLRKELVEVIVYQNGEQRTVLHTDKCHQIISKALLSLLKQSTNQYKRVITSDFVEGLKKAVSAVELNIIPPKTIDLLKLDKKILISNLFLPLSEGYSKGRAFIIVNSKTDDEAQTYLNFKAAEKFDDLNTCVDKKE